MNRRNFLKLVLLFLVLTLSGCGTSAEQKEKVTLIIKTAPLWVSNGEDTEIEESYQLLEQAGTAFAEQYEKADVTVKVVKFEYVDEKEYVSKCFGTENAADILLEAYFNAFSYVYNGNVISLDDILTDGLKEDFVEPDFSMGQIENKTYMLPYFSLQNTLCYNKELFRKCGLEEFISDEQKIQSWSLQEWEQILSTLAEKLPPMHYPMMMYGGNNQGDTHIMTLLRSQGSTFFDEDGKFHLNTKEGIAGLRWIQESYARGYFPPGCETMEMTDCVELFNNNQLAICMQNKPQLLENRENFGFVNFPSVDEKGLSTTFVTGFLVFDNGNDVKLQASKDFLRFFYENEEYLSYEKSGIPSNHSVLEHSKQPYLEAYLENRDTVIDFHGNNPNWQGRNTSVRSVFSPHIKALLKGEETPEEAAVGIDRDCNAAIEAVLVNIHE